MCEHVLGLVPLAPEERPKAKLPHAEKERRNLLAATQYRQREGTLDVPSKHRESIMLDDGTTKQIGLGLFLANSRRRKADIPQERAARLTELGMRWE